ncbi:preprotein translocase subunit SecY [Pontibacter sp. BT310]|jgi:preprotein translocase subunit SecY|uniref:Protein translocase subunit SecY n=1 Tax=Pontibacter populi TaxID=890055 RepID=A0ABS6X7U2_9BACT|nr:MULTISPECIES: preprotein translocase subunit SecY [Pontibacter]MBJ6117207.1 preprotein translocase subunit SecY [Pontibacter sp. BT310]MBR0569632.1 preprotein translocase subunit SecY [Microvirga sp. STS03]MBW3364060.1 preprotein translocase subunit SecY [Pontibacter populi]
MKKFLTTIKNIFAIDDLRVRILNTIGFIAIFRLGSYVVLPGVDPNQLKANTAGLFGLLDTFLGGAFSNASIFALGIMPYISASIVLQLLTIAVPYFQKMQKEGESGRKKINQITRVLTIVITLAQAVGFVATINSEAIAINTTLFTITSMIVLTAGTIFCMWLGEKITDKGIGNGISMLIMIGIVSRFPGAIAAEFLSKQLNGALLFLFELAVLFFVVMSVIMLTQAIRRIPVQYAKQVGGNSLYSGQRQFIPLKVNAAGVMPIIFAQSLMFLPSMIAGMWADTSETANYIGSTFSDFTSWQYNLVFGLLILVFTYFYTAISVDPNRIADDLKRSGGFIPGVKPGRATSEYIDAILTRITLPGAIYLALVAIFPAIAMLFGITREFSQFFGGTSLIIMVGVVLDTLQQIESYLLMRHYDGMMKSGKLRGRTENIAMVS